MSSGFNPNTMPPRASKRQIIAQFPNGYSGTIEKVSAAVQKRASEAFMGIALDGTNRMVKIPDPVVEVSPVTISIVVSKADAFISALRENFQKDVNKPAQLGPLNIVSYGDDQQIESSISLVSPFLQEIKFPDGDTGSHGEALVEVILQPQDITSGLTVQDFFTTPPGLAGAPGSGLA